MAQYAAEIKSFAALNPPLLMIQNLDGATALPVPLVARLHREHPCFSWIKVETADRGRKLSALREATGGTLRLGTAGRDLIELLDRGVHAYLSTFLPAVYTRIWRHHRAGERDEAVAWYRRILPLLAFMATHQKIQWRFTKAILHAQGLFATTAVRVDTPPLDGHEEALVKELAAYAVALESSLTP